jgi:uncharacterized protein (TIGR03083 family)
LSERVFAPWVEPVARILAEDRRAVIEFVRSVRAESWDELSALEGWTRKDVLAHLAGGNDQMLQLVLRAVVAGERIDPAMLNPDTNAENARRVVERRSWTIDALVAELKRDDDEVQSLLSQLRSAHEPLKLAGSPLTLGQFLDIVRHERHDMEHLAQMRG